MLVPQYKGINYESKENCFEKCASVKSILLYGDETAIPKPWITLLVPTYKRVDLLSQALESALTQGHCKFMWVIVTQKIFVLGIILTVDSFWHEGNM